MGWDGFACAIHSNNHNHNNIMNLYLILSSSSKI